MYCHQLASLIGADICSKGQTFVERSRYQSESVAVVQLAQRLYLNFLAQNTPFDKAINTFNSVKASLGRRDQTLLYMAYETEGVDLETSA